LAILRQVEICLANHNLFFIGIEKNDLQLRWLGYKGIGRRVKLKRSFHLEFVANAYLAILRSLDSSINVLASSNPEHHKAGSIWGILQEQFSDCQLELQLV